MKAKKGLDLCVICLQTRVNCCYFKRLIYENMCFELWMLLCSQLRGKIEPQLTTQQGWDMMPILTTLIQLGRCSPPVPDHYHNEHFPAHWADNGSSRGDRQATPDKVDFSLMWQLQLTRKPYGKQAASSFFLRTSSIIRYRSRPQPRRLLIPVSRPARRQDPIAAAVLQCFPCPQPRYAIRVHGNEPVCFPIPIDHRRLHESTYLLWLSALPVARPVPSFRRQESEITRWLLRHSLFFSNPGAQEMIRQRQANPR